MNHHYIDDRKHSRFDNLSRIHGDWDAAKSESRDPIMRVFADRYPVRAFRETLRIRETRADHWTERRRRQQRTCTKAGAFGQKAVAASGRHFGHGDAGLKHSMRNVARRDKPPIAEPAQLQSAVAAVSADRSDDGAARNAARGP
jgi:hypothetical protein